jgi:hypothetical protein
MVAAFVRVSGEERHRVVGAIMVVDLLCFAKREIAKWAPGTDL